MISILNQLDNGTVCHYYMNHPFKLVKLKEYICWKQTYTSS